VTFPALSLERTDDAARWDAALECSGQPWTGFSGLGWLQLAAGLTGTRLTPLVVRRDGADVGVLPWVSRRRGPASVVGWVPFPYLSPVVPPALLADLLALIAQRGRKERAVVIQHVFAPGADVDAATLRAAGYAVAQDTTRRLDLRGGVDAVWEAMERRARKAVRKAERGGVEVVTDRDPRATLGAVVAEAFAARGLSSGFGPEFPPTADALRAATEARVTVAVQDGREVGALVTLAHRGQACVWQGGVRRSARGSGANAALYWDAIRWAAAGCTTLDLVGHPEPGIRTFKEQFGGAESTYLVADRSWALWRRARSLSAARSSGRRPSAEPSGGHAA
jgi:hypothetical protein